jgi:hypothetical protein
MRHSDAGVKKYPSTRMRAKELPQLYRAYISLPAVSLKGQSRRSDCAPVTSVYPKAENFSASRDFAFVPIAAVPKRAFPQGSSHPKSCSSRTGPLFAFNFVNA